MSSSENHAQDQKADEDLASTSEELGGPSASSNQPPIPGWPFPGNPPSYLSHENIEMQNLGPPYPLPLPPPVGPEQDAPKPRERPFNFGYFKPQKDVRTKLFIGLIVFLVVVIITLSTLLPVFAHKKAVMPLQHNTTISISITIFTTLVSTESLLFTTTEVSLTTQVTTENLSFTATEIISTTQVTTESAFTATEVSATTQTAVQTTTLTSLLSNPTSVPNCWTLLQDICANTTEVPSNIHSGAFGECEEVFGYFYCGVIQELENQHIFIIPADDTPFCGGMKDFCNGIQIGNPEGLQSSSPASTSSGIQVIPVTGGWVAEATNTGVAVRQLSRIQRPTRLPGPLLTDYL